MIESSKPEIDAARIAQSLRQGGRVLPIPGLHQGGNGMQESRHEAESPVPAGDLEKLADATAKMLGTESTRVAWLMGFLVGSALVEKPEPEAGPERPRRRPRRAAAAEGA